ncbi:MAG TPA: universal stress protein [Jatrophihabitans sp.]|jgi:nucleotide-binding universal stress UspA family protein|uniref:universal stress protein n=1 Tax=Jatrophihabitans sp. TaxID=1932789 RepID=UPI002DF8979F|nr:universal stress protein [Jatrophihabitans sp.]
MELQGEVLFGLSDATESWTALDWAADEARARNRPLHIVRAYHWSAGAVPWELADDRAIALDLRGVAETRLRHAIAHVEETFPEVTVRATVVEGIPWDVLVEKSVHADVTVVGSRRLSAIGAAVMGSVSTVVAARAAGPVVVVEGPPGDKAELARVVVGVDGSSASDDVLAFAFDHASRHGVPLKAVFCWRPDLAAVMSWRPEQPAPERAERWLAEAVAGWQNKYPDVAVQRAVVREHAIAGLVLESAAQDLLVVGGNARHARVASLLGSVSQGVLHHATCPVAVVHPRAEV